MQQYFLLSKLKVVSLNPCSESPLLFVCLFVDEPCKASVAKVISVIIYICLRLLGCDFESSQTKLDIGCFST